jgi:hypothetical protein
MIHPTSSTQDIEFFNSEESIDNYVYYYFDVVSCIGSTTSSGVVM